MATKTKPPAPPVPAGPAAPKARQGTAAWIKTHKQEAALGAGGIVVALALYVRSKNAAAGANNPNPSTATSSSLQPINGVNDVMPEASTAAGGSGTGGGWWRGRGGSGSSSSSVGTTTTPTLSGTPITAGGSPFQGYGEQSIGGSPYDLLGYTSGSSFAGYNVGGGAPVFYQSPGGSIQTNLSAQAIAGLPAGTEVLTPTAYQSQISQNAVTEQI